MRVPYGADGSHSGFKPGRTVWTRNADTLLWSAGAAGVLH